MSDDERMALALRLADGSWTSADRDRLREAIAGRRRRLIRTAMTVLAAAAAAAAAAGWFGLFRGDAASGLDGVVFGAPVGLVLIGLVLVALGVAAFYRRYGAQSEVEPGPASPAALLALTRRQRASLAAQIYGRSPVEQTRLPLTREVAVAVIAATRPSWYSGGLLVLLVLNLSDASSVWTRWLAAGLLIWVALMTAVTLRRRRQAQTFLGSRDVPEPVAG